LPQPPQCLHTIHARHLDIEDGEIWRRSPETVKRGNPVGVRVDPVTLGFEPTSGTTLAPARSQPKPACATAAD
jgi:hypothetical protein